MRCHVLLSIICDSFFLSNLYFIFDVFCHAHASSPMHCMFHSVFYLSYNKYFEQLYVTVKEREKKTVENKS